MKKITRLIMMFVMSAFLLTAFGCADMNQTESKMQPDKVFTTEEAIMAIEDSTIYFAYDRYSLSDSAKATLKNIATVINRYGTLYVTIEGHCDERGTEEYNLALGERRAKAAYDYLIQMGVNPAHISIISYGKMYPAVSGNHEAAWSKNRRDAFRVKEEEESRNP